MARLFSAVLAALALLTVNELSANQGRIEIVESELRRYILQRTGWKQENFELRIMPDPVIPLIAGPAKLRVLRGPTSFAPGTQTFHMRAEIDGKEDAPFVVRADVKLFAEVVVPIRPLAQRELVALEDVRLERRELSSRNTRYYQRIEDVTGKQTMRGIAVSEILTPAVLDRPHLVRRGSAVTLLYEAGALRVETPGLAEEAGRAGDFIQVKNSASGKSMRGEVLDERTVKVN
jgi:flagella basal body P-ring formation protein FlgA